MHYERIPLGVVARFLANGRVLPRILEYEARDFEVDCLVSCNPCDPKTLAVECTAPLTECVVRLGGIIKTIYFESSTRKWFSIKERKW